MEYLEGETLAQQLAKGALPVPLALRHSIEMADALSQAQRKGVVHRDLKPGNVMLIAASEYTKGAGSWSPDGKFLAFEERHPDTLSDIWVLSVEGNRTPQALMRERFNEYEPVFSPNGRWLAYVSDEAGRDEVYVRSFPGLAGKQPISTGGGRYPVWSRDGRELFYLSGNKMMYVPLFRSAPGAIYQNAGYVDAARTRAGAAWLSRQWFKAAAEITRVANSRAADPESGSCQISHR